MKLSVPFRRRGPARFSPIQRLIILTWSLILVPRLLQTFTAPKYRVSVEAASESSLSAVASTGNRIVQVLLVGYCVFIVLSRLRSLPTKRLWSLALMLAPWIFQIVRDLYAGESIKLTTVFYGTVVMAVWVLQPRYRDLRYLVWPVVFVAAISMLIAIVKPSAGIFSSVSGVGIVQDKQILPFGVLVGIFTSGNNLGQVLAIGSPVLLLMHGRRRVAAAALIGFALVWTASRSSLLAVALALITVLLLTALPSVVRGAVAILAGLVAVGLVIALPLMTTSDTAFTNRGYIWRLSLEAWRTSPWVGLGSNWYTVISGSSRGIFDTAFHGHNTFVQLLVSGGIILAALTGAILWDLLTVSARWAGRGELFPIALMVALLGTCTLEVSIGYVGRSFLLPVVALPVAMLLLSPDSGRSSSLRRVTEAVPVETKSPVQRQVRVG